MTIITIIQSLAALYLLYTSLVALNTMRKGTRHAIRFAYIALSGGSASILVSPFYFRDIFECIFVVGVALFVAGERRETDV